MNKENEFDQPSEPVIPELVPQIPPINRSLGDWLKILLLIVLVVAMGMIAINQTFEWYYKVEFLKSPCGLCGELNPEVQDCIDILNSPRASYWTPDGWTNPYEEIEFKIKE